MGMIVTNNPTANDPVSWLTAVWSALSHWGDTLVDHDCEAGQHDWDEITTVMAWITEELGYELDGNGDYVPLEPDPIGALARTHNEPDPEMEQKIQKLMPIVRRLVNEGSN